MRNKSIAILLNALFTRIAIDEISGVAEDDAMEVFENDYYW